MNIRKGDKVIVVKGKDRGKSDKVIKVLPKNAAIVVSGLNIRKKTIRPKKQGEKGQIVEVPWPMRAENVMVVCSSCGKPTRVGHRFTENGIKERHCKKCKAKL